MTGAGDRVARSSRWTASGCIDRSAFDDPPVAPLGQQPLGARVVGDHRLLVDARRGERERDRHAGAVLAHGAVHQHRLIRRRCRARPRRRDRRSPPRAGGTSRRAGCRPRRTTRPNRGTAARAGSASARPPTRLGAWATSSSARRSMMRRMPRPPSAATPASSSCARLPERNSTPERVRAGARGQAADVAEVDGAGNDRVERVDHQAAPEAASRSSPTRSSRGGTL